MKDLFNVLVIDNDPDPRETLKHCLLKLGCEVATAETAEHGMKKLEDFQYDAVFASLCLQKLGGRGIARWIKERENHDTKFFLTTSWKGELEHDLLQVDGIHDVIRKPYSFSEIRDKVVEHLG